MANKIGKRTIQLENKPRIISYGSIVGKKEHEGPIGHEFDKYIIDSFFGEKSFVPPGISAASGPFLCRA